MGQLVAGRVHPGLARDLTSGCGSVSIADFPSPGRPTNASKRCVTIEGPHLFRSGA